MPLNCAPCWTPDNPTGRRNYVLNGFNNGNGWNHCPPDPTVYTGGPYRTIIDDGIGPARTFFFEARIPVDPCCYDAAELAAFNVALADDANWTIRDLSRDVLFENTIPAAEIPAAGLITVETPAVIVYDRFTDGYILNFVISVGAIPAINPAAAPNNLPIDAISASFTVPDCNGIPVTYTAFQGFFNDPCQVIYGDRPCFRHTFYAPAPCVDPCLNSVHFYVPICGDPTTIIHAGCFSGNGVFLPDLDNPDPAAAQLIRDTWNMIGEYDQYDQMFYVHMLNGAGIGCDCCPFIIVNPTAEQIANPTVDVPAAGSVTPPFDAASGVIPDPLPEGWQGAPVRIDMCCTTDTCNTTFNNSVTPA